MLKYLFSLRLRIIVVLFGFLFSTSSYSVDRIVALSPHSVELLFALGVGDKIVGTTSFADYPEAARSIPQVGGYNGIQIEKILALQPDLVVAWEGGNSSSDLDQLERLGLKLYRSETTELAEIEREVMELGRLVGLEEKAAQLSREFNAQWQSIKEANLGKPPVSFFYQLWADPFRTIAAGSWINEILTTCGGVNIFSDENMDYPQVSLETIIKAKPQSIIIPSHHGSGVGQAGMLADWDEIPAVKNNHLFWVNGDLLHRFSLRVIDGMKEICESFDRVRQVKSADNI